MALAFPGNYSKLKKTVARTSLPGKWRELRYGQKQFRTDDGGVLNWWETTGTLTFQGSNSAAKEELIQAFGKIASAQGLLHSKHRKTLRDSNEEVDDLKALIAEARILRRKLKALIKRAEIIPAASKW
jgi:hypothetical protein